MDFGGNYSCPPGPPSQKYSFIVEVSSGLILLSTKSIYAQTKNVNIVVPRVYFYIPWWFLFIILVKIKLSNSVDTHIEIVKFVK